MIKKKNDNFNEEDHGRGQEKMVCVGGIWSKYFIYMYKNVIMKPIIMYGEHVNKNTLKYVPIWFWMLMSLQNSHAEALV